jgi:hypothetical protein
LKKKIVIAHLHFVTLDNVIFLCWIQNRLVRTLSKDKRKVQLAMLWQKVRPLVDFLAQKSKKLKWNFIMIIIVFSLCSKT